MPNTRRLMQARDTLRVVCSTADVQTNGLNVKRVRAVPSRPEVD